ncbi:hypothetical protein DFP73DRAFT_593041 [Morchella snyderi]|nr:hypothetical protein DFP73DRAFT_593041 [Morchella snyderi]
MEHDGRPAGLNFRDNGRKRGHPNTPIPDRNAPGMGSQASLSSFFALAPPPGTPAPPRLDQTQSQNMDEVPQEEPLSVYATEEDYSKPYFPRIDYLEPSIVPSDMHNRMDLNYTSWAIRHAVITNIQPLKHEQETVLKELRDLAQFVKGIGLHSKYLIDQSAKQDKAIDLVREGLAQTIYPLIKKVEEDQALLTKQTVQQQPTRPQQPQQPPQQQQAQQQLPRSFANVARANNQNQETFQMVQRKKAAKKADPLFKPEFSRTNRDVIVECNAPSVQAPCNQTPSEIRTRINAGFPDAKCHFIAARKTLNHNIVLETKFDSSAETVLAYKHEIKDALTAMRIYVIDIKANSKWSKFLLHGIPTTIGDGLDAGQLVASEIRNNYGDKFELAQIPRWITKPEKRAGKEHSSIIVALPGSFTIQTLGLQSLLLFDRHCSLEPYLNIREDTQCRCGHCAEDHTTDNHPCKSCSGGVKCTHSPIRCYNCKGFHKAIDRACPERAKATLRASLRFNESRPQKIAPALINVAPVIPAPGAPAPISTPAPPAPEPTIQVPATPAPAPVVNDHDMGNAQQKCARDGFPGVPLQLFRVDASFGHAGPPRFDPTQPQNLDEEYPQAYPQEYPQEDPQGEPLSIYASKEDYSKTYLPRVDYLDPSIVPGEMHNRMDMNYTSWAIRHAVITHTQPLKTEQETILKELLDLAQFVKGIALHTKYIIDHTNKHDKAINAVREGLAQTIYPLIKKVEEDQALLTKQATKQFEETQTLILSRPNPPPPPPALPALPALPITARPAHPRPAQTVQQQPPQPPQPQQLQRPQQQPQPSRSFANVARANNPLQETFQVVQRKKAAKKADPLFKPEFSRTNREVIVECNAPSIQAPCNQTPSEIRTRINTGFPDAKCHFIAARKTLNHNIVLETKFDSSAETVLAYKHEIKDALTAMRIYVIDIKANSKWSKFLLHGIPTTIGDGLDAGQLVASEIRNNYGDKFELAQIPRWITKPEKRAGKEHSSIIVALPGSFTIQTLGLQSLLLFDRHCSLEPYLNIREDTQCRNCLEYGHRQERCSHETGRCGHCAEDHTTDNHPCKSCSGGVKCTHSPIRCYNCKGFHKAIDRACPGGAGATLKASLRFNESRPQKIAPALINVVAPAPIPIPDPIPTPAPPATIQVPATPAPAPVEKDHDMGNTQQV